MLRRHFWPIPVVLFGLFGCDGDGPTSSQTLPRDTVAGIYTLTELSFDPQGSLPEVDILPRLDPAFLPELVVGRTSNVFQLIFRDPVTGNFRTVDGTMTVLRSGIRIDFPAGDTIAAKLLFPGSMTFEFQDTADVQLLFDRDDVSVQLPRLRELVPEFADEPLTDPVPGRLQATFTLRER